MKGLDAHLYFAIRFDSLLRSCTTQSWAFNICHSNLTVKIRGRACEDYKSVLKHCSRRVMTPAVLVLVYTDQFVTKALEGATEASQHAQAA